jgi:hypothetical protein
MLPASGIAHRFLDQPRKQRTKLWVVARVFFRRIAVIGDAVIPAVTAPIGLRVPFEQMQRDLKEVAFERAARGARMRVSAFMTIKLGAQTSRVETRRLQVTSSASLAATQVASAASSLSSMLARAFIKSVMLSLA